MVEVPGNANLPIGGFERRQSGDWRCQDSYALRARRLIVSQFLIVFAEIFKLEVSEPEGVTRALPACPGSRRSCGSRRRMVYLPNARNGIERMLCAQRGRTPGLPCRQAHNRLRCAADRHFEQ